MNNRFCNFCNQEFNDPETGEAELIFHQIVWHGDQV